MAAEARRRIEAVFAEEGLTVVGWRDVPVDDSMLGSQARSVEPSFHQVFVTGEADGVISMRNIAGQVSKIKRDDVKEEKHLPQSMMPAGLAAGLTVEEFTSLIEYLVTLKSIGG
ncbi:MAG: hypothetical protein EBY07_16550 [Actinobacteria bacterium]|nr:hypothetical protein [Actinomycetota bacterium]